MNEYDMQSYEVYLLGAWFFVILFCLCSLLYDILESNEKMRSW